MNINANTKIATILKQSPAALDAIVSINSKFEKLRNPLLRKLMAGRTSIGMAAKISGNPVEDFYKKLIPLGFTVIETEGQKSGVKKPKLPAFFNELKPEQIIEFDARPIIEADEDTLTTILKKVKGINQHEALKIINSFEPTPLIVLLEKQGFESFTDTINDNLVETYFYKKSDKEVALDEIEKSSQGWEQLLEKYTGKLETIDVRKLEMPGPMMAILEAINTLAPEKALFVYHKRIPVFLLPELREKGFDYRVKEIATNEVHLLIFKE
jgi:uncharacterized protein (DUF2249 family)